jgi:hypothetical protein
MATKNLLVRGGADFSGLKKAMDKTQQQIKGFKDRVTNSLKGLGVALAAVGAGITLGAAIKDAMEFEAHMGTLNQTLGKSTKDFTEWMNTTGSALGLSKLQLAKYGNQYSLTLKGIAKDQDDLAKKTQQTIEAVALIRSKNGMEITEISDRMRSAMNGEADGADELGVNVRVAAIEASKAYKMMANGQPFSKLSVEMQKAIRWQHTMDTIASNLGDTMANNTSMKMAVFQGSLLNLRMALGQAWLPILNIALPALTKLTNALTRAFTVFAQFMSALFGYKADNGSGLGAQAEAAQSLGDSVSGVGDAYKKAGKAAKKAQGSLAGFDEINTLGGSSGDTGADDGGDAGGGIGAGGSIAPTVEMPVIDTNTIPTKIQEMANKVKGSFNDMWTRIKEFGNQFKAAFVDVGPALQPIRDAIEPIKIAFGNIGRSATDMYQNFLKPAATYILTDFIPSIVAGITKTLAPIFADTLVWAVELFGKIFQNVTTVATNLWNNTWKPALESFKNGFLEAFDMAGSALQTFLNGTIKPFVDYAINKFIIPISEKIHQVIVPVFTEVFVWALKEAAKWFKWAADLMNDIYKTVIEPVFNLVKKIVMDTLDIIMKLWQKYGKDLLNNLSELMDGLRGTFQLLWDKVLKPIIQPFLEMLSWLWTKHLKGLVEEIGAFVFKVVNAALEIYNYFIKPLIDGVIVLLGPAFTVAFNAIVSVIGTSIALISDILKGFFKILGGVIDFVTGAFTGNWEKAWEGVKDIFKGVFDSLWGIIKFPLNLIIDGVNTLIDGLNKLSIPKMNIPGIGEIGGWGINIPKIPKLAKGGITNGPMMAVIGDNPGGREVVSPLDDLQDIIASAVGTAVSQAMQIGGGNNGGPVNLIIDGTTIARAIGPYLNKENNRIGGSMIITT